MAETSTVNNTLNVTYDQYVFNTFKQMNIITAMNLSKYLELRINKIYIYT